jgi:hypothetical protein
MDIFDHARAGRAKLDLTMDGEARLAPGNAIVVIEVLSLLSWAFVISIATALWSAV